MVKRRLIEGIKQAVEDIQSKQREVRLIDQKLDPKAKRKLRDEEKKILLKHKEEFRKEIRDMAKKLEQPVEDLTSTLRTILEGEAQAEQAKKELVEAQPPPRRVDREEVHEPRAAVPGPDPGRQHRPDEGRRQVRVPPRLQVLDVCDVVDPPGDHAGDCRPGADDPHPGAHDRDDQQADPHVAGARAGARPRADLGGDRAAHGYSGVQGAQGPQDRAGAHLARNADRRRGRFTSWRLHPGHERGVSVGCGHQPESARNRPTTC